MDLNLSDRQVGILLAGTRMNWGYPFAHTQPYPLDRIGQETVDAAIERFRQIRQDNHKDETYGLRPVALSQDETSVLTAILEVCLKECKGNSTSIHIHLQAENEDEVRELVARLRACPF